MAKATSGRDDDSPHISYDDTGSPGVADSMSASYTEPKKVLQMAKAYNKDTSGRDHDSPHISYDDTGSPGVSDSKSASYTEPKKILQIPKMKEPAEDRKERGPNLKWILFYLENPITMKSFIRKHIETLCWADQVRYDLLDILKQYASPGSKFNDDMEPGTLLNILKDILENYKRNLMLLDLKVEGTGLLEGTGLKIRVEESAKKVGELLESYKLRMDEAEECAEFLHGIIRDNLKEIHDLEVKRDQLYNALLNVKRGLFDVDTPTKEEFFEELKKHLESDQHLNSSLKDELVVEKRKNHFFFKEVCKLKEERVLEEQDKMKEIAELARNLELDESLKAEILDKIKSLTANPDEIDKAIENWMEKIQSSISEKESEIRRLGDSLKTMEDQIAELKADHNKAYENYHELGNVIMDMDREIEHKLEVFNSKQHQLQYLDDGIHQLGTKFSSSSPSTIYYDAKSPGSMPEFLGKSSHLSSGSLAVSPELGYSTSKTAITDNSRFRTSHHSTPMSGIFPPKFEPEHNISLNSSPYFAPLPLKIPDASGSYTLSSEESPGNARRGSPYRGGTYFSDSNQTSIHSTPGSASPQYSVTPPSPFSVPIPAMQSYGESGIMLGAPGTVAIAGPSRKFAPKTATMDPSAPFHVSNYFDIGKSFNLRTSCETSTPYQQVTRVSSSIPESESSGRMVDHPLTIMHSSGITPTQSETPFISQSRFGYTDPTAGILNMPPELVPFKDVSPSEGISPDVVTYGIPPVITPTTTRRHGIFTPKGIFKKKHFNLRRLFEPELSDSPHLKRSPQYYSEDSGSPEQYEYPYDENIMHKTFQASPVINRTVASPPHVMNATFNRSPTPAMDKSFYGSSSYKINETFDKSPSSAMGEIFVASSPYANRSPALAMNRTFNASSPSSINRTPISSQLHTFNQTFDASPPYTMNRTFNNSPSSPLGRTFEQNVSPASSPYAMDRTFDGSPMTDIGRRFDASFPQHTNGKFYASSPHALNTTFDTSPSHAINRTFNNSGISPIGRSFQKSPSAALSPDAMNGTFNVSLPHTINRTFNTSSHHPLNTTHDASPTCALNRTFQTSQSPQLGRNIQQNPTANFNGTRPQNVTIDLESTFHRSKSPVLDKTYDKSRLSDGSYNTGRSP